MIKIIRCYVYYEFSGSCACVNNGYVRVNNDWVCVNNGYASSSIKGGIEPLFEKYFPTYALTCLH